MGIEQPYLEKIETRVIKKYNPNYGDDRVCECGHLYHRHFDTYEDMYPCGCKYCGCYEFVEDNIKTMQNDNFIRGVDKLWKKHGVIKRFSH